MPAGPPGNFLRNKKKPPNRPAYGPTPRWKKGEAMEEKRVSLEKKAS